MQGSRVQLAQRFHISQRDLRLVDPWAPIPLPVSFMRRKHAILANLGSIRALISRCEVCRAPTALTAPPSMAPHAQQQHQHAEHLHQHAQNLHQH